MATIRTTTPADSPLDRLNEHVAQARAYTHHHRVTDALSEVADAIECLGEIARDLLGDTRDEDD